MSITRHHNEWLSLVPNSGPFLSLPVLANAFPQGLDATIVFALYSGEELGLFGSTHLAERFHKRGTRVEAAFTNDIDGNVVADDGSVDSTSVRIYAANPDAGPSRELGRYAWSIGSVYQGGFPSRFDVNAIFDPSGE